MSSPWKPLNGNVGQHHDWTNCPSGADIAPYWERFEESYSKPTSKNTSVLPTAIYSARPVVYWSLKTALALKTRTAT